MKDPSLYKKKMTMSKKPTTNIKVLKAQLKASEEEKAFLSLQVSLLRDVAVENKQLREKIRSMETQQVNPYIFPYPSGTIPGTVFRGNPIITWDSNSPSLAITSNNTSNELSIKNAASLMGKMAAERAEKRVEETLRQVGKTVTAKI